VVIASSREAEAGVGSLTDSEKEKFAFIAD